MESANNNQEKLTFGQKLELLVRLVNRQAIRPFLDSLTIPQLVQAHHFLWDAMVEIHVRTQDYEFRREDVTRHMIPSAKYQKMQGCDLRIDYCKGVECIWSNPICAGNKVKNNMEVMARQIMKYFDGARVEKASDVLAK
ncbi:MAG: hypothetical protein Q9P14_14030 [candidate division KSB1 bacterium]|nr:hypothetical protein [candidate division KSB1 bacterium]MDQ7066029.1 hypothetical protein [candidate division KSB1 bacterium]